MSRKTLSTVEKISELDFLKSNTVDSAVVKFAMGKSTIFKMKRQKRNSDLNLWKIRTQIKGVNVLLRRSVYLRRVLLQRFGDLARNPHSLVAEYR